MEEPGAIKDSFVLRKGEETVGGYSGTQEAPLRMAWLEWLRFGKQ